MMFNQLLTATSGSTDTMGMLLGTLGPVVLMFAVFYWIVDVKGWKRWTFFFRVIGMNSIAIYMAQRFIGFDKAAAFFFKGAIGLMPDAWHAAGGRLAYVVVCWLFLLILYRHKIFFKV